jgi:ankyrin repeat protein
MTDTPGRVTGKLDRKNIIALLEEGAKPDSLLIYGKNALIEAVRHKDVVIAELLISRGATINMRTAEGETPLLIAVETGNPIMLLMLLSSGGDVNGRILNERTPLFAAIERGNKEIVELLIARGADVNACSRQGFTPLHIAVKEKRKDMISLLLKNGARPDARAADGATPLSLAESRGDLGLIRQMGGIRIYNEKRAAIAAARRKSSSELQRLLAGLFMTSAKAVLTPDVPEGEIKGTIPLHDRVRSLLDAINDDIDHIARYVDMGAINSSDAEIEDTLWRAYYDRWRSFSRQIRTSPCSDEIRKMLSTVELLLATHRPEECDRYVEKSGLTLKM